MVFAARCEEDGSAGSNATTVHPVFVAVNGTRGESFHTWIPPAVLLDSGPPRSSCYLVAPGRRVERDGLYGVPASCRRKL